MKTVFSGLFYVIFLGSCFLFRPDIESLGSVTVSTGDRVEINGRFFGRQRTGSQVLFGSIPVSSASIVEWSSGRIVFQAPRIRKTVLVQVKTVAGISRPFVLGDSRRFPRVDDEAWLADAPFIEQHTPVSGGPGTLVSLRGKGFGDRIGSSRIWANRSDSSPVLGLEAPDLDKYIPVRPEEIKIWTNNLVSFWLPGGFSSGNLLVQVGSTFSNPVFFDRVANSGEIVEEGEREWRLHQNVRIQQVGAFAGNRLYVHLPLPISGMGQRMAKLISCDPRPLRWGQSPTIFELKELRTGRGINIKQETVVKTWSVRTRVQPSVSGGYDSSRPQIRQALAEDEWIKPNEVVALARQIAGRGGNQWSRAILLYNYTIDRLTWDDAVQNLSLADYLAEGKADSRGYSVLLCSLLRASGIPARLVGGIIIDMEDETRSWWWVEMWLEGLGWIPLDPVLGSGSVVISDVPGANGTVSDYYMGNMEGRHVAFSRGVLGSDSIRSGSRNHSPRGLYSLQSIWEETVGNVESYKSFWQVPDYLAEPVTEDERENMEDAG